MLIHHPKNPKLKLARAYTKPSAVSVDNVCLGANYTEEEVEFLKAMERYMEAKHRRFPAFTETMAVLISLGYRKIAEPTALPVYQRESVSDDVTHE